MAILSKDFNGHIVAQCAGCARHYYAYLESEIRHFYANRKTFRKDLCSICRTAKKLGFFQYQCVGCKTMVSGTLDQVANCLNIRDLAMCRTCMEGYYGRYDKNNKAMMIANEAMKNKKFCKEPRRYPHYLKFRKEEAAYGPAVRNLTKRIYRQFKENINPNNLPIATSGTEGGHHVDHIVSVSLCFRCGVPIHEAAAPENLQVIPWRLNLLRG